MKKLVLIIGILMFVSLGYFAYLNMYQVVSFIYYPGKTLNSLGLGLLIALLAFYSSLASSFISTSKILELDERVRKYMRNAERSSIVTEESSDKVKALQAKIDTLEIALKEALSKN